MDNHHFIKLTIVEVSRKTDYNYKIFNKIYIFIILIIDGGNNRIIFKF